MEKIKIALVVGHTMRSKGYHSPYGIDNEYDFNKSIAEEISAICCGVKVFLHDSSISGYVSRVKNTAEKINNKDFDLVLELHYNSHSTEQANGSEALYYHKNKKGKEAANYFCSLMHEKMKYRSRGAKPLSNRRQRGFSAVYEPNPTALILEPFFGSNESDVKKFNRKKYIDVILKTIEHYETIN